MNRMVYDLRTNLYQDIHYRNFNDTLIVYDILNKIEYRLNLFHNPFNISLSFIIQQITWDLYNV